MPCSQPPADGQPPRNESHESRPRMEVEPATGRPCPPPISLGEMARCRKSPFKAMPRTSVCSSLRLFSLCAVAMPRIALSHVPGNHRQVTDRPGDCVLVHKRLWKNRRTKTPSHDPTYGPGPAADTRQRCRKTRLSCVRQGVISPVPRPSSPVPPPSSVAPSSPRAPPRVP